MNNREPSIELKAYAKINLGLDITGRREDGYHDLKTIMQQVDLYDVIRLYAEAEITGSQEPGQILISCDHSMIPTDESNLAYIDFEKCRLCRKCVTTCPKHAILDVNFPTPPPAPKPKEAPKPVETPKPEEKPVEKPVEAPKPEEKPVEAPKPKKAPAPKRGAFLDTDSSISIK